MSLAPRRRRLVVTAVVAALIGSAALAAPATAGATPTAAARPNAVGVHYAVIKPACAQPSDPSANRCFALRRVAVPKGTPGATAYTVTSAKTAGAAGGYTPEDFASAYGFDPNKATTATVGIVIWNDAPNIVADLNAFDNHYHGLDSTFPASETLGTSFKVIGQNGSSKLPPVDPTDDNGDSTIETSLDAEAIRGVCHKCKLLLVEANSSSDSDLAAAENQAIAQGATVVNNSWGGSENTAPSSSLTAAFSHPGIAYTVASGDDGWYDWDDVWFQGDNPSQRQTAEYPAADPHVIAVGGTKLTVTATGKRGAETVWNEDGIESSAVAAGVDYGASGGGCSKRYTAPGWQPHVPGWSATGCGTHRLTNDISADADPATGFDVYDSSYQDPAQPTAGGWATIGGTSLSAPLIAGMIGLAGGPGKVRYPGASLYANLIKHPSSLNDVTSGGTGFCGGEAVKTCGSDVQSQWTGNSTNPNSIVLEDSSNNLYPVGLIDCSWKNTSPSTKATARLTQCNATRGFDGPSGVGTPKGLGVFAVVHPSASISATESKRTATLTAKLTEPVGGISAKSYSWNFGDHHTSTSAKPKHTYAKAGTYTVTVKIVDAQGLTATHTSKVVVGHAPTISFHGATSVKHKHSIAYNAKGSHTNNTGGRISKVSWKWGDKHTSTGTSVHHTWAKKGKYTVTETITDSTGYSRHTSRRITVK